MIVHILFKEPKTIWGHGKVICVYSTKSDAKEAAEKMNAASESFVYSVISKKVKE